MIVAINLAEVVAEVESLFPINEMALVGNDIATLDALFWHNPLTIRFGAGRAAESDLGAAARRLADRRGRCQPRRSAGGSRYSAGVATSLPSTFPSSSVLGSTAA